MVKDICTYKYLTNKVKQGCTQGPMVKACRGDYVLVLFYVL